jgi:hypothetical protein
MCGSGPNVLAKRGRKIESPRVLCERFVLIGAMNPCPCGWYGDPVKECTCSNAMVSRYQADQRRPPDLRPAAGPRRSLLGQPSAAYIEVPRVEYEKRSDDRLGEPSNLFLKNRRHPGAGGGGERTAAPALWGGQRVVVQRGHGAGRGAGPLPGGRRRAEPAAGGDAAAPRGHPHERPGPMRILRESGAF